MRHIQLSTGEEIIVEPTKVTSTVDVGGPHSRFRIAMTGMELLLMALEKRGLLVGDVDEAVEDALINLGGMYNS